MTVELDPISSEQSEVRLLKRALFEAPPKEPQHQRIDLSQMDGGLGWATGYEERKWAFEYFGSYAEHMNSFLCSDHFPELNAWRLQRLSDPFLRSFADHTGKHEPAVALNFRVMFNTKIVGDFSIHPYSEDHPSQRPELYGGSLDILIQNALLLPHDALSGFLSLVSEPLGLDEAGALSGTRLTAIHGALTAALWEAMRRRSSLVELAFGYSGYAPRGRKLGTA